MVKYRIVERLPGKFCIQQRHTCLWWEFWIYQDSECGQLDFDSPEEAEGVARKWLALEAHKERVIREVS